MEFTIELYYENGKYCAYIGEDNSSGYEIAEETASERGKRIGEFFEQYS